MKIYLYNPAMVKRYKDKRTQNLNKHDVNIILIKENDRRGFVIYNGITVKCV